MLANLKSHCITQGDDIAVKGCSVQHVVNILGAFGVEICQGETISKRKQTKMISVNGSESKKTVVRGMYMVFGGICLLCCIPFDDRWRFRFWSIASSTNRNHTLCLCENIGRADQTQHDTVGNVSRYLVGTEAARRKRLAILEGAIFTELKAQGMNVFQNRDPHIYSLLTFQNETLH